LGDLHGCIAARIFNQQYFDGVGLMRDETLNLLKSLCEAACFVMCRDDEGEKWLSTSFK
jgi:hypothetical protein